MIIIDLFSHFYFRPIIYFTPSGLMINKNKLQVTGLQAPPGAEYLNYYLFFC